jgi:hypothetical protein
MTLKKALNDFVRVVAEEAERNPDFARHVEEALGLQPKPPKPPKPNTSRPANRRAAAALDPVQLVRQGESALRVGLGELNIEQLKDIVADYGMDPAKLVMKWKDPQRIIDRIVELSIGRVRKGESFLTSGSGGGLLEP